MIDDLFKKIPAPDKRFPVFRFVQPIVARTEWILHRNVEPFETFWLVFDTKNEIFGTISGALFVSPAAIGCYQKMPFVGWIKAAVIGLNGPRNAVERDFAGDYVECMARLTEPRERIESDHRVRGEWARNGSALRTRLIEIGDMQRLSPDRKGTGSPRCPHDRRGHLRRLRSGREIMVQPAKIHGGAHRVSQYVVR